jgi:enoyl-CoA hydratase
VSGASNRIACTEETMAYQNILVDTRERVATITLNRPDKLNAMNWPLLAELDEALDAAERDDAVGAIIIKGAGKCFSTGFDMGADMGHPPRHKIQEGSFHRSSVWNSRAHVQQHIDYWMKIWNLWKPVVAQVHGFCLAGAVELALMCDLLVVGDDARIGCPLVRGQNVEDMFRVVAWHVGIKRAKQLQLTGDTLTAREAVRYGLANCMFPVASLDEKTSEIARKIAQVDPTLQMLNKQCVNKMFEIQGFRTAMEYDGVWDSLGHFHHTPWEKTFHEQGWKAASEQRDAPFGGIFGRTFPVDE